MLIYVYTIPLCDNILKVAFLVFVSTSNFTALQFTAVAGTAARPRTFKQV